MTHVKVVDRWEEDKPTTTPPDAEIRAHNGGTIFFRPHFHHRVRIRLSPVLRAQPSDDDQTALIVSACLVSDHMSGLGPGEEKASPISAPKKSTIWDSTIDGLRFTIHSHTMRISFPREMPNDIKGLLLDH